MLRLVLECLGNRGRQALLPITCSSLLPECLPASGAAWLLQVKKVYMKANLLVHPDKVRQRNGTPEQVAIADMVFDVLKDAWNSFRG